MKVLLFDVTLNPMYESLGIESIAQFLRYNNIEVVLHTINMNNLPEVEIQHVECNFDIYGFALFHTNALYVYALSRLIKKNNPTAYIYVGGHLATSATEHIFDDCHDIDFIVRGNGEYPLLSFIRAVESNNDINKLDCVVTRNSEGEKEIAVSDISIMPSPARDHVQKYNYDGYIARLNASQGCRGGCSFCSVNSFHNKHSRWQGKDISLIFKEVEYLNKEFGVNSFMFCDASLEDPGVLGKERIKNFCTQVLNYKVPLSFRCYLRTETFAEEDFKLLKLMKKAGFTTVFLGVEAGNNSDLKLYNKIATLENNDKAINMFKKAGINVVIGFIMLNPFSDETTLKDNFLILQRNNISDMKCYTSKVLVFWKTKLHNLIKKHELLSPNFNYLNPDQYLFKNKYVSEVDNFLNAYIVDSKLLFSNNAFCDVDEQNDRLRWIYKNKSEKLTAIFLEHDKLKMSIGYILADYFRLLYVDNDIKQAVSMFDSFNIKLNEIYQKSFRVQIKLARELNKVNT